MNVSVPDKFPPHLHNLKACFADRRRLLLGKALASRRSKSSTDIIIDAPPRARQSLTNTGPALLLYRVHQLRLRPVLCHKPKGLPGFLLALHMPLHEPFHLAKTRFIRCRSRSRLLPDEQRLRKLGDKQVLRGERPKAPQSSMRQESTHTS